MRWHTRLANGLLEQALRSGGIAPRGAGGIDDLAMLINGAVQVRPRATEAGVQFVHPPLLAHRSAMGTCGVPKQWEETLDPAVDGTPVNDQAALGEPLDDVGIT